MDKEIAVECVSTEQKINVVKYVREKIRPLLGFNPDNLWNRYILITGSDAGCHSSFGSEKYNVLSFSEFEEKYLMKSSKIEVFPDIFIGDIVVSLSFRESCREANELFKVLDKSNENRLYYENPEKGESSSTEANTWRKATLEEATAYSKGVRHLKDMSFKTEIKVMKLEKSDIGRYLKALKDNPNSGNHVYKDKYYRILNINETGGSIDVPDWFKQYNQQYKFKFSTIRDGGYELMPPGWVPEKKEEVISLDINLIKDSWYKFDYNHSQTQQYLFKYLKKEGNSIWGSKYKLLGSSVSKTEDVNLVREQYAKNLRVADLEEVYKYFPEEKPQAKKQEKIDYVECTYSEDKEAFKVGSVYKITNLKGGEFDIFYETGKEYKGCPMTGNMWKFRSSTKEAYDIQFRPKAMENPPFSFI
jgi:hypothetical protein